MVIIKLQKVVLNLVLLSLSKVSLYLFALWHTFKDLNYVCVYYCKSS